MTKRVLSLFTSLIMVISLVGVLPAVTVSAETYGDYEYEVLDGGTVEITEYIGNSTEVEIPSVIDGKAVTSIGYWAFEVCHSLVSVTIPNSVISIGDWAFEYCKSLTSIKIPDSVTSIGDRAFYGCKRLTNITIPDSVTSIGYWAFARCDNLTIKCNKGSYAEQYAIENYINYELLDAPNSSSQNLTNKPNSNITTKSPVVTKPTKSPASTKATRSSAQVKKDKDAATKAMKQAKLNILNVKSKAKKINESWRNVYFLNLAICVSISRIRSHPNIISLLFLELLALDCNLSLRYRLLDKNLLEGLLG